MLRNSRRRSSSNSNGTAVFANRRSSITLKDIEYIQNVINRARHISAHVILLIVISAPLFIHFYYTLIYKYKGNIWNVHYKNWRHFMPKIFHPFPWLLVIGTIPLQFLFFWLLPANERRFNNANGQLIRQRWNAFSACLLQMLLYSLGACLGLYRADVLIEKWDGVMFVGLLLCLLIQFYLNCFLDNGENEESNSDTTIHSFYFGRHLQPSVFDMDVKSFVTNRVMCSFWACYLIGAFAHQRFLFGKTTGAFLCIALLQFLYLFRRLWSDNSTPETLDNQNDRAGFYRLWGVLVFLPTLYLTPLTLICQTDSTPSNAICIAIFIFGLFAQLLTTAIDGQKREFRLCKGQMKINDKDPFYIVAKYRKDTGEGATNLLLGSGWWGMARHLNYTFEILTFLIWSLPLRLDYLIGYLPVAFLTLLLLGRMSRDECRCLLKYHQNWIQYTSRVPYQLIPHLY